MPLPWSHAADGTGQSQLSSRTASTGINILTIPVIRDTPIGDGVNGASGSRATTAATSAPTLAAAGKHQYSYLHCHFGQSYSDVPVGGESVTDSVPVATQIAAPALLDADAAHPVTRATAVGAALANVGGGGKANGHSEDNEELHFDLEVEYVR